MNRYALQVGWLVRRRPVMIDRKISQLNKKKSTYKRCFQKKKYFRIRKKATTTEGDDFLV